MGASYKQTGTGATTVLPFPYNTSILNVLLQTHPTMKKSGKFFISTCSSTSWIPALNLPITERKHSLNKGKYTKLYYIQLNLTTCLSQTWFNSFWGKTLSKGELDFTGFIQKLQLFWRTFQGPYSIFKDHLPGMQFHILFYCTLMHFPTSF